MQWGACILLAHGHGRDPLEGQERDPIIDRIKDRDILLRKRYYFSVYEFKGYFLTGQKGQSISNISLIADKAPIIIIVSL
jgi:hypothetical protein